MRKKNIEKKTKTNKKKIEICLISIDIQALIILENKTKQNKKEISSQQTDFRTQFLQWQCANKKINNNLPKNK